MHFSLIGAGIFLYIVFHSSNTTDDISMKTVSHHLCLEFIFSDTLLQVRILYGTFTGMAIVAALILLFLRRPPYEKKKMNQSYGELLGIIVFKKNVYLHKEKF